MFFSSQKPLVAIDIGGYSVKVAQLRKTRKGYELLGFGMTHLPPDTVVDGEVENPQALTEALRNLLKAEKIKNKDAVVGICGQSVVIKKISVPVMSEDDLAEMIREEAEQYIPFDIEDVHMDFQIVKADGGVPAAGAAPAAAAEEKQMDVMIVAVQKDVIKSFMDVFKEVGVNVRVVDLSVFALENIFGLADRADYESAVALVNIGASMTNINVLERGTTAFARDIQMGSSVISEEIQKSLSVGFAEAEKIKLGHLPEGHSRQEIIPLIMAGVEELCLEIRKTFDLYEKTAELKVSKIYVSGGGAMLEGIDRMIRDQLKIDTELFNAFSGVVFDQKRFDPRYLEAMAPVAAIPLGLALRTASDK
ncbi:MAG: type IV pilus assembly protein PilM [Nitrospinae bacterium]|nr:type IV pilus assembly protein PilM [Nitrospinota bacterium]